MKLKEFWYDLPDKLIAQYPIKNRDESKLMVLDKQTKTVAHKIFKDIVDYLEEGDCLVLNNTKVIPARIYGEKKQCENAEPVKVEFLLLKNIEGNVWEVLVKPGRRLKTGAEVIFGNGKLNAKIKDILENGNRIVEFYFDGVFNQILDEIGLMPLPPYINASLDDKDRYQTIYAKTLGSSAAPTAGLHFTTEILEKLKQKNIEIAYITLHVGIGTFRPVKVENIEEHIMHTESYVLKSEDVDKINNAKKRGKKVFAVGTTSCRVLETLGNDKGEVQEGEGETNIFIYPGYKYKIVDGLITNFHLPESSLIMLVSALVNRDYIMKAYQEAINKEYRFFSFGDAMLIK